MTNIEVLMQDGCTKAEAENQFPSPLGVSYFQIVYEESDKDYFIEESVSQGFTEEEALDNWNNLPQVDNYRIMYVL